MKKDFLPKELNGSPDSRACLNINIGKMSTELHYHDCVEIIYVMRGAVRVFFDSGWRELSCDTLLFIPPGCIHRCVSCDDSAEQIVIGFTDELICEDSSSRKNILCPYRAGNISTGYVISGDDCHEIQRIMDKLCDLGDSTELSAHLSLDADVLSIYSVIYGLWERRGILQTSRVSSPLVCEIRKYVSERFASSISAIELSRILNISYSYLAKIMTREFGMSLGNYIIAYRIEMAKKLLLSSENSIAEIAYECGFASSSAFICRFKTLTGKTPLVFRNEALEKFLD